MMNLKLEVMVTRKEFDKTLEYHRQCGYKITIKEQRDEITVLSDAPGYKITPVAAAVKDLSTGRWIRWIYYRLPG